MTLSSEKSLYRNSHTNHHCLLMFLSISMIMISIYLTHHYYITKFPQGLSGTSLCEINSFLSCSKITDSPWSNIKGAPISIFGILVGTLILLGYLFKNNHYEGTLHSILYLNAILSFILLLYSLVVLKGLCLFCFCYYLCAWASAFHFYKKSSLRSLHYGHVIIFILIAGSLLASFSLYSHSKSTRLHLIKESLLKDFYSYKNLGVPKQNSPFLLAGSQETLNKTPLLVSVFSDFQCPHCQTLAKQLHRIAELYKGKITVQYFFYPMDPNCNSSIKRSSHIYACAAAYLAACLPEKFISIHDEIFQNQELLSQEWIDDIAKREGVLQCTKDPKTKDQIMKMIEMASTQFNIKFTPIMIVNGVKIEGVIPRRYTEFILDSLLENE